jgi:cytochrome c-type biogenesis protein CcmH
MTLWFVFALMTAAAIFAVLLPLGVGSRAQTGGSETTVYKDQLAEIDRDVAAGLIGATEADAARVEISRRLLAAADQTRDPPVQSNTRLRRSAALLSLVGLPVLAVAVYLPLGSPRLGDFPLAQRARAPDATQPLDALVAKVEQHLEQNPTDARGWTVLAPVLARLGRFDDAARAYRNAIAYGGETADRRADLGEVIAAAAGGVVTAEAKGEFEHAQALQADDPKASYFLGLAAEQDGRNADAASIWRALLSKAPQNAPWRPLIEAALTRVSVPGAPRRDGRGQGHERQRPRHDDPRHGRAPGDPAEAERRRCRGLAAAGACLYGDGRSRQGARRAIRCKAGGRQRCRAAAAAQ